MSREQLVRIVKRGMAHAAAGTQDQAEGVYRVPAANYYDPIRWEREMAAVFRRLPLVMGFSSELREPGAYRAMEAAGVPVLLVRGQDGAMRAFVNMCSHRGAIVVEEGTGSARRFACPYHAWTYDTHGDLVGVLDADDFGELDRSCLGLTPLPVAERAGVIWATLNPSGPGLDLDTFLCGYGEMLEHLGLDDCFVVGRQSLDGPNWKVAYDGYLDLYHLPVLHKNTFGSNFSNKAMYDAWGPHQRATGPNRYEKLQGVPEDEWSAADMVGGVWTIFPHISIAAFDAGGKVYMVSQLFPGATPGTSVTIQNFLHTCPPDDEQQELVEKTMDFLAHVVGNEDYYTGKRVQRAAETGTKADFLFGRNEGGGQRFHKWVDALLETADEDLPALFVRGVS
jgi:phenylpropionate dioxygenase-like ring-hydroxylating dioxygenase large terminal subunit